MNKISTLALLLFLFNVGLPGFGHSQGYIKHSSFAGGSGIDEPTDMQVINGETYSLGTTRSTNFPVTNGSTYQGEKDITLIKYGVAGNVVFATYLGGRGNDVVTSMLVVNSDIYLTGYTDSVNFPVTNGSTFTGSKDVFLTKLSSTGSIVFSTYLGGTQSETPVSSGLHIIGSEVIVCGTTSSASFPVTNNSSYNGGTTDVFITKFSALNGSVTYSGLFGGNREDYLVKAESENTDLLLIGHTFSTNLPVTIGGPVGDSQENIFVLKMNTTSSSIQYFRYLGGIGKDLLSASKLQNGVLHLAGNTFSWNYPVTNGTQISGVLYDYIDGFYTRLAADGYIQYSTFVATGDLDNITQLILSQGNTYLGGRSTSTQNGEKKIEIFKIDAVGNFAFTKTVSIGLGNPGSLSFQVLNDEIYAAGICMNPSYPTTNGSQYISGGTAFFTKFDQAGNIAASTFLGKVSNIFPVLNSGNKFYLYGSTDVAGMPVSNSTPIIGSADNFVLVLNSDATSYFGGYFGGSQLETSTTFAVDNGDVYISARTGSNNYPVTSANAYAGNFDQVISKISSCPVNYTLLNDTLSPQTQTICKFGLAQKISGVEISVPADSLPPIYRNGIITGQDPVRANYQWQSAASAAGPWTNIPAAFFKDYTPVLGAVNQYYRRLSFSSPVCGNAQLHISSVASVLVNTLTAPSINGGGPFNTCPGSPVTLGSTPTVSGGNPPYVSYTWDMGASQVPNPVVTPQTSTIYTLVVKDAAGCEQIGQAQVLTYRADAGPDKGACGGIATRIGAPAIIGIPGLTYFWSPPAGLTSTSVAQPFANPVVPTTYLLRLTVPKADGGTCSTEDSVRIIPVAAPLTVNIAGPDEVLCLDDSISIGTAPEAGFNYTWSPGSYLTANNYSNVFYYPGNIIMPEPNPAILYLSAQKDGCSFPDQMVVSTIEARAGLDGCGPRQVGLPDRTPNINETYSWSIISGPGSFLGPTDQPQVQVSASVGGNTRYRLTVTYNGHTCSDDVVVPFDCTGCWALIEVQASYLCPDYDVNGGNVTLVASSSFPNATFTWTPQEGLSNYTGSVVHLTDNVPRTYFVAASDPLISPVPCSTYVKVNDPAFSLPLFDAPDAVTCLGVPVRIGAANVAGYTYQWTGNGLSSNLVSNPLATVNVETAFPVKVQDGNGCELTDTVVVAIENPAAMAGPDWLVCGNGIIKLGEPAQANTTYLWEPESSPWQNGTNQYSAEPEVFVATNLTFVVTATSPSGCVTTDTAHVSVFSNPVIPNAPDTSVCFQSAVLIGSPALPGVSYQWSPATGLSDPTAAQPLASPASTTTYTVTAIFPGSCAASATDNVTITVRSAAFNLPDINFCPEEGPVQLGIGAPQNMVSYNWQPQQLVTNPAIANPSTLNPPPFVTTQFLLTIINNEGCSYRDTIRLIPEITLPIAGPDKLLCKGQATTIGSATNQTGTPISYSWSPAANLSDPSSPNPVFTSVTGGVFAYVLTKTNSDVACSSRDTVIIKVIDSLIPQLNPATLCQNSCIPIGTAAVPGIQYQWSPATGLSNPNISNPVACITTSPILYTLTGTDLNGCQSSSNVLLTPNNAATPQISIPVLAACSGDTNVFFNPSITPAGSYSYTWTPDNGTLSNIYVLNPEIFISGNGSTQYLLEVADTVTGCRNSATATIVVNNCTELSTIGDYVWFDANLNGIQDPPEFGENSILVTLYNGADVNIATTVTDGDGLYLFENVPAGNGYYVVFDLPSGYAFTTQFAGGIAAGNNSKVDVNGRTNSFNVPSGADIRFVDAGIVPAGCVPVTLLSFTGTPRDKKTFLHWQTTSEYNNRYFYVEQGSTSSKFKTIGRLNGHGTTESLHQYSIVDSAPAPGINYYRLKQVDFDGDSAYSYIVPVEFKNVADVVVFYHNFSHSVQIIFSKPQDELTLKLFSSSGQLFRTAKVPAGTTRFNLELPALASGIYMLHFLNDSFNTAKRLLIQK